MMFASETPPEVMLRTTRIAMVTYGFRQLGDGGLLYLTVPWATAFRSGKCQDIELCAFETEYQYKVQDAVQSVL